MLDFTVSGAAYFDALPQPVLLYGTTIQYCNSAARALFAGLGRRLEPGCPVPPELPPPEQAPCALTVRLPGGDWTAVLRPLETGALCQLNPVRRSDEEALDQLHRLSLQLRLRLSLTALSVEQLQTELSELEQLRSWEPVARVNRNLHQLLRLSDHLDLYTRSDEELSDLYPACALQLNEFCAELTAAVDPVARQAGHRMAFEDAAGPLWVRVNGDLLRRLFYNLISNALRAGGNLRLRLREGQDCALLTLTDSGSGITPAQLQTLFSPEQDVSGHGFALGLSLCRRLVQLWGGQLMVAPGEKGTTVSLSLPLCGSDGFLRDSRPAPEGGYDLLLTELSDVLPAVLYGQEDVF